MQSCHGRGVACIYSVHVYIQHLHICIHTYMQSCHWRGVACIHSVHVYMLHTASIYIYVYIHTCNHATAELWLTYISTSIHTYYVTCVHATAEVWLTYINTFIHTGRAAFTYTYRHICNHATGEVWLTYTGTHNVIHCDIHACMHACMHTCMHTVAHTYIHAYRSIHACIQWHTTSKYIYICMPYACMRLWVVIDTHKDYNGGVHISQYSPRFTCMPQAAQWNCACVRTYASVLRAHTY